MDLFSDKLKLNSGIRREILNDLDPFQRSAVKYVASQNHIGYGGIVLPYTVRSESLQCPEVFHILLREDREFAGKRLEELISKEMKKQELETEQGPQLQLSRMGILNAIQIIYFSRFSSKDDRNPIELIGFRENMLAEMMPDLYEMFDQRDMNCPLVLLPPGSFGDSCNHLVSVNDIYKKDRRKRIGFIEGLLQY